MVYNESVTSGNDVRRRGIAFLLRFPCPRNKCSEKGFSMSYPLLQAHRGVATECPENTLPAIRLAIAQGYGVIEIDPEYTADGEIVLLHDKTLNRTARRPDGTPLPAEVAIRAISLAEARTYDAGIAFAPKFRGTPIPTLAEVLDATEASGIQLKIDNKFQSFPAPMREKLLTLLRPYAHRVRLTVSRTEELPSLLSALPGVRVDYDGEVTEERLAELSRRIPRERLTVWLPFRCAATSWVKVPFADETLAAAVRRVGGLGLWLIKSAADFAAVCAEFAPDIVETDGCIKPPHRVGARYDMHSHSENSHDSTCPVSVMAQAMRDRGIAGFAVTDHCDVEFCDRLDLPAIFAHAVADADAEDAKGQIRVLRGIEVGEGIWHPEVAPSLLARFPFDVVIGSVHAVRCPGEDMPYARIDFSSWDETKLNAYMDTYFDDMWEMVLTGDFDILAHMTCPVRYICGKYGRPLDLHRHEEKIRRILAEIIRRGIALEVNTACLVPGSTFPEWIPQTWILKMYRELGGYLLTVGADAHRAECAATGFDTVLPVLRQMGFPDIYCYEGRQPIPCRIPE